jgi:hypothetical protein
MEEQQTISVSTRSAGMRYGLILAAFSIVSFLVFSLSGINMSEGPGAWVNRLLSMTVMVIVFVLAHNYFKQNGNGFMNFGQGIGIGFWASLTGTGISSTFMYIYIKFVDSGFLDMIKEQQMAQFQERGMSDEQIEQAMKFASMFTTPEAIFIFGLVGGIIFGVIIALIVSIFTQKKNPDAIPS